MTERALASAGASWTDLGDWIEHSYSEAEMLEMVAAVRQQELAQASRHNGHTVLREMADYCYERRERLEEKHHDFVDKMPAQARRRALSLRERGYLVSLYVQLGGP